MQCKNQDIGSSYGAYHVPKPILPLQNEPLQPLAAPTVHHQHIHTHIHQGSSSIKPNHHQVPPHHHQVPPPHHHATSQRPHNNQFLPSFPTFNGKELEPKFPVNQQIFYREDCLCVPRSFCAREDIVPNRFSDDFSNLISPRTRKTNITSIASDLAEEAEVILDNTDSIDNSNRQFNKVNTNQNSTDSSTRNKVCEACNYKHFNTFTSQCLYFEVK